MENQDKLEGFLICLLCLVFGFYCSKQEALSYGKKSF